MTEIKPKQLRGADLSYQDHSVGVFEHADMRGANLRRANFTSADLSDSDLSDADMTGALFIGADLRRANLLGSVLCGADLSDTNLRGATFVGADLRGASLCGADLSDADMTGASLVGADLRGANLCRANLQVAEMYRANLTGANIDYSVWPLHCGSGGVIIDRRIAAQLALHFCALECDDTDYQSARAAVLGFAKSSHHATCLQASCATSFVGDQDEIHRKL